MKKVAILENTSILRLRLDRVITKLGFTEIEHIRDNIVSWTPKTSVFKDAVLIIIDLDYPETDPIELIRVIRQTDKHSDTPIIGLSKSSEISFLKKAITAGCSDFILKPFTDDALIIRLHRLLNISIAQATAFIPENAPDAPLDDSALHIRWSNDFKIGIPEIDEDHSLIIKKYEMLYRLMKEGEGHEYYQELLSFLTDYVNQHFEHEEKLQLEISYSSYDEHKAIHEDFKARVARIIDEHKNKTATNFDLIQINLFLKDWLVRHILIEDNKLGLFYASRVHKD